MAFCVFRYSPQKGMNAKIGKISKSKYFKIQPIFGFTEFDILKNYQKGFESSEWGRIHSLFPFSSIAHMMRLKDYFPAADKIV